MTKAKKISIAIVAILLGVLATIFGVGYSLKASASEEGIASHHVEENESKSSRMFTSLSVTINGGDGSIWTTVRNDFTFFPATVNVIVELYCSEEYQSAYENMTLIATNNIADLDMNNSITATASTEGHERYWQGVARYKIDNDCWKVLSTGTARFSPTGEYLGVL